jgi:PAB-dependent poly(A)-specific ribonuclease subunit 2
MECWVCKACSDGPDDSDPTRSLASMAPNPANSNEVVAGGTGLMLANTSTGQIVRRVSGLV